MTGPESGVRSSAAKRGKVLIVDDDPVVLRVIREWLERAGFEVLTRGEALGTTGAVAVDKPDVILLDYRMPEINGEALAHLLEINPTTNKSAIIFHSSEDLAFLQERATTLGITGAIPKTDNEKMFLAQFERLFARAKKARS